MKRITAIIFALLFFLMCSVISFADNIYIVDDGEEDFIPDIPTTTAPAETTTAASGSDSIFGDFGSIGDYIDGFSGILGDGIDSILSGFEGLGQFDINGGETTTKSSSTLPTINSGERPTQSQFASQITTEAPETEVYQQETTTPVKENELPSVLVVNGSDGEDNILSGSTLTILVFVGAIVVLILVAAIVLVLLTRRTEYNSAVMDKSTLPTIEKPKAMSQFTDDNIGEDGNDYGNITYWNDNSGDK